MEVVAANNRYEEKTFHLHLEIQAKADIKAVRAILSNFKDFQRLNEAITASELLPPPQEGTARAKITLNDCVFFFCSTKAQVQDMSWENPETFIVDIVPAMSDFQRGRSVWRLENRGQGLTRITVDALMQPKFWIPPLLGPHLIRGLMEKRTLQMVEKLEQLASQ